VYRSLVRTRQVVAVLRQQNIPSTVLMGVMISSFVMPHLFYGNFETSLGRELGHSIFVTSGPVARLNQFHWLVLVGVALLALPRALPQNVSADRWLVLIGICLSTSAQLVGALTSDISMNRSINIHLPVLLVAGVFCTQMSVSFREAVRYVLISAAALIAISLVSALRNLELVVNTSDSRAPMFLLDHRLTGVLSAPVSAGYLGAMIGIIGWVERRTLAPFVVASGILIAVLSDTRSALFLIVFGTVMIFTKRFGVLMWALPISTGIIAVFLWLVAPRGQLQLLPEDAGSFNGRTDYWEIGFQAFATSPLFGNPEVVGGAAFPNAHSTVLQVLATSGLFGLMALVLLNLGLCIAGCQPSPHRPVRLAVLAIFIFSQFTELVLPAGISFGSVYFFWIMILLISRDDQPDHQFEYHTSATS